MRDLLAETDQVLTEGAEAQRLARGGLLEHFQHAAESLPVPEDQMRREDLARKRR